MRESTPKTPRPSTPPAFGKNVQRLRKEKKLSLDVLADRSRVSKAMLSQIEQGKVNPTVGILWKIAEGLHVQITDLLDIERPRVHFEVQTKETSPVLRSDDGKCEIQILSPASMIEEVELYLLYFEAGGELASPPHFSHTEEICTVLDGELEIRAGDQNTRIKPYQSVHYSADVPHTIRNVARKPAKAYLAVRYQRG